MAIQPQVPDAIGNLKFPFLQNVETGIVARAGGGQTSAYQLGAQINRVDTVASGNDSVKLPKIVPSPGALSKTGASVGTIIVLANNGANSMQAFGGNFNFGGALGTVGDTINAVATGTGNPVAAAGVVLCFAVSFNPTTKVGTWLMSTFAATAAGSFTTLAASNAVTFSGIETGLTAHAGGGQAAALLLDATKFSHNVTTVGTAADSVKLALATGSGALAFVKNSAAANSMQLFGSGTDTIDGVATGTGVAVAAGKGRLLHDAVAGNWISVAGA